MAYKSYKKKSEVAHHRSKTLSKDVATAFQGFLTGLTTLGSFQAIQKLFKLIDVKVIFSAGLADGDGTGHVYVVGTNVIISSPFF